MRRSTLLVVFAMAVLLAGCGGEQTADRDIENIRPSAGMAAFEEALQERMSEIKTREQYDQVRAELAQNVLDDLDTSELTPLENYYYANLLEHAQKNEQANEIYESVAMEDSLAGRRASTKLMNNMAMDENYTALSEAVENYMERFPEAHHEHEPALARPVMNLAYYYMEEGQNEQAVEIIETEMDRIDYAAPYDSFRLFGFAKDAYEAVGREEEYQEKLNEVVANLEGKIEDLEAELPEEPTPLQMQQLQKWQRLQSAVAGTLKHLQLIGQEAPDIDFTQHFYNTEPFTLDELEGKVVMIDFWANWCGPCKDAFPHMRELYEEYKDDGFVIVGVTSFQGRFVDGDISEQNITRERELELTEQFIEDHNMNWPIVFSETSVFNPDYGVQGIPTFAVLNRDGEVAMIQVGSGETSEEKLRETVTELLNE